MKQWNEGAPAQKYIPKNIPLVQITTSSAVPTNNSVYFRVPVIDARVRVKISVVFVMAAGSAFETDITGFAALWLAELEEDQTGVSGRDLPCTNIEGTLAAPTAVPASSPLLGYSREFVSAAAAIQGKFSILSNVTLGTWVLQTRYQPEPGVVFTPEEWQEIKALCSPNAITPKISF